LRHKLVLDFFWSNRLAKIWHLRDTIHHIAED
jgi:hypothetical protein